MHCKKYGVFNVSQERFESFDMANAPHYEKSVNAMALDIIDQSVE